MTEESFYNPLLHDDEEELVTVSPAEPVAKAASPDTKKATSDTPRRGTPRARVTERDAVLLGFLGKFRVATADTLAMLLKAEAFPGNTATGECTSVDTTRRRLQKLERLGLIEHDRTWKGDIIYGVRKSGLAAAMDFGYLYRPQEADEPGLKGLSITELPHNLAVSSVAARFASQTEMMSGLSHIPLDGLISEHTLRAATRPHELRIARLKKANAPSDYGLSQNPELYFWGDYRDSRLRTLMKEAEGDSETWVSSLEQEPELWTLGHPHKTTNSLGRQKHFPDLVVSREEKRRPGKAASIFVEVELTPKPMGGYETILSTYAEEFKRGLYMGCYYVTNSEHVKNMITKADKKLGLNMVGKTLRFVPLKNRDGSLAKDGKRIGE